MQLASSWRSSYLLILLLLPVSGAFTCTTVSVSA